LDLAPSPEQEQLRADVRALCAQFGNEYWRELDQQRAYPDIAPTLTALPPADAFARALDAAKGLGWTIVASDVAKGTIEATQSSRWMGFTDDIAIRVAARADGQPGARIDIRSHSRQGRHDFGVNAARVRSWTAKLKTEPGI